jgi:glycosyltransferase involved in cell wall biosynthesis
VNERIRVAHLITKLELGGAQLNTLYTYENLDEEKFSPYLISGPGGILVPNEEKKDHFIICQELERSVHPLHDLQALLRLRRILVRLNPHIVHTHSSKAGILGRLAARGAKIPVLIHSVHGFSFAPAQPFWQRNLYLFTEKMIAPLTTHFIFVSEDDARVARSQGLIGDNYSLIRSGFPLKKFTGPGAAREKLRSRFGIGENEVVCGIIAPFKPQKGLFHLIAIAELVLKKKPDTIFFIAGDGDMRIALEKEIRRKGMEANFRLPGFVTDIENAIEVFDIGVSTALWEGLPQSLVQMRLKKKPLVASDIPGNREIVRDGRNGFLVDVADHSLFSRRIIDLIEKRDLRERLGRCPGEDFSEWDAERMVRKQEALYESLWKGHPPTADR